MVQRIPENMGKYCYECRAQLEYTGPTLKPRYCSDQCQQALERRQRRNRPPSPETELYGSTLNWCGRRTPWRRRSGSWDYCGKGATIPAEATQFCTDFFLTDIRTAAATR